MTAPNIQTTLQQVATGEISPDEAARLLQLDSGSNRHGQESDPAGLDFATLDHKRAERVGFPEVVYGLSKTPKQTAEIAARIFEENQVVLVTKSSEEAFDLLRKSVPEAVWDDSCNAIWADERPEKQLITGVTVVAAGTSDLPIAKEAVLTATLMGCEVKLITDVGVAGLHRLSSRIDDLTNSRVLVVVAGMEGALPSVVGGLVKAPVIALPTSVGYGASMGGVTALLAMMNSCAPGVSVVNIDNGFGAGYQAASIVGATWK